MRWSSVLRSMFALMAFMALGSPVAVAKQRSAPTQDTTSSPTAQAGGREYGEDDPLDTPTVPGTVAQIFDGIAAAPADAPDAVKQLIWSANKIVGSPYRLGGGHVLGFEDDAYDCSGTVSYALRGAGLLKMPLASGDLMSWGKAKQGAWITVYANGGHTYAVIAGLRLDTSAAGEKRSSGKGPRWRSNLRGGAGFKVRHPNGL